MNDANESVIRVKAFCDYLPNTECLRPTHHGPSLYRRDVLAILDEVERLRATLAKREADESNELREARRLLERIVDNPENMTADTLLRSDVFRFIGLASQQAKDGSP